MTPEERARTIAYLDLQEGRGSVPVLDDAGISELLSTTRRIAVIGASNDPSRPSNDVFRNLVRSGFDCVPVNPNVASVEGVRSYPTLAEAVGATGPIDIVDVFRRAELCARTPRRRSRSVRGACGCSSASSTGRRQRSRTRPGWRS